MPAAMAGSTQTPQLSVQFTPLQRSRRRPSRAKIEPCVSGLPWSSVCSRSPWARCAAMPSSRSSSRSNNRNNSRRSRRASPPSDQPPAGQQPPVFRAGINFVRVDVIVTDKTGAAVTNLKPTDFEITEEGKPQKIETFKYVQLDGGLLPGPDGPPRAIRTDYDEESEAARDDVRLFGVFLDDYHVRDGNSLRGPPADRAIHRDPARPVRHDGPDVSAPAGGGGAILAEPRRDQEGHRGLSRPQIRLRRRRTSSRSSTRITPPRSSSASATRCRCRRSQALISRMGGLKEGRKALVLVSEGYSNILPPQMRDANSQMPGFGNPAAGNPHGGGQRSQRSPRAVDREPRHGQRSARDLCGGQPQQRRDLPGRSARSVHG